MTQYQSLQTCPYALYCNEPFSIRRYLETPLRLFYTQISDFVYQLSTVTKRNKLVLSFFVGYRTIAAFVVVSAQLFIGCVSLETISSLYFFFQLYLAQSTDINSLLVKYSVFSELNLIPNEKCLLWQARFSPNQLLRNVSCFPSLHNWYQVNSEAETCFLHRAV